MLSPYGTDVTKLSCQNQNAAMHHGQFCRKFVRMSATLPVFLLNCHGFGREMAIVDDKGVVWKSVT
jgi:hypothetical protein